MVNSTGEAIKINQPLNIWKIPSVSKVLSATMSAEARGALDRWKDGLVAQLGEQGFQEHQKRKFINVSYNKILMSLFFSSFFARLSISLCGSQPLVRQTSSNSS